MIVSAAVHSDDNKRISFYITQYSNHLHHLKIKEQKVMNQNTSS